MHIHHLLAIIILLVTITLTTHASPTPSPSQSKNLSTHTKNTVYCVPTNTSRKCTYVWKTFYNSTLPSTQRAYNKACIYSPSCVPLINEIDAQKYSRELGQTQVPKVPKVKLPLYTFPLVIVEENAQGKWDRRVEAVKVTGYEDKGGQGMFYTGRGIFPIFKTEGSGKVWGGEKGVFVVGMRSS